MAGRQSARLAAWVDVTADLLRAPVGVFPVDEVIEHLAASFDAPLVSYNWRGPEGPAGWRIHVDGDGTIGGRPAGPLLATADEFLASALDDHPLIRWFAHTGRTAAQSMARVPPALAGPRRDAVREIFRYHGLDQQLSIPLFQAGRCHQAFVLTRPDHRDFSDQELADAQRVQRLLRALNAQARAIAAVVPAPAPDGRAVLTARELAVLALVARGATASAIGHGLGISPRTAAKHVEHIYRKLGVRDRVNAVLVAQRLGILPPAGDSGGTKIGSGSRGPRRDVPRSASTRP